MVSQCSFLAKAALLVAMPFLAQGARHGSRLVAPGTTAKAADVARHNQTQPQNLRAGAPATPAQLAVEKAVQDPEHAHPDPDKKIMDDITKMRVERCVKMRKAHAEDFNQFEECLDLLKEVCQPGKDLKMDGDKHEQPSGEGFCSAYFKQSRRMALESAQACVKAAAESTESEEYKKCIPFMERLCRPGDDMIMDSDKKEKSTGEGFCQKFFPQKEKKEEKKEEKDEKKEEKKEEGEPEEKKEPEKKNETEQEKEPKKNETGEVKESSEGKIGRMHMDESIGVPEQGFEGPKVAHDEGKSSVDDWSTEYGPDHPGSADVEEICKKNPGNRWCKLHFPRHDKKKPCATRNAAVAAKASLALLLPFAALLGRTAP